MIRAYEIHMGRVRATGRPKHLFHLISRNLVTTQEEEGCVDQKGTVMGTLLHGLFENGCLRQALFNSLGRKKGIEILAECYSKEAEYDRLAELVRQNMDTVFLNRLINSQ